MPGHGAPRLPAHGVSERGGHHAQHRLSSHCQAARRGARLQLPHAGGWGRKISVSLPIHLKSVITIQKGLEYLEINICVCR